MAEETKDGFIRMYFKKNKVWAELAADGAALAETGGKVKIKYQLNQSHEYLVPVSALRKLEDGPDPEADEAPKKPAKTAKKDAAAAPKSTAKTKKDAATPHDNSQLPENAIAMYTDGASSGNPGPAGIGVYLKFGAHEKEISEYIGTATNNIAELTAVARGLSAIKNKTLPVIIFTDSQYVLGLLG